MPEQPDLKKIGDEFADTVKMLMRDWIPFPDAAYWKKFGIEPNADGTIDTPGGFRIPTRELCEVQQLKELYEK